MTSDDTAATMEQCLREASEQTQETHADAAPDEETTASTGSDTADAASGSAADGTTSREVSLNGESVDIDPDTTVGELRETEGIGSEEVFTYRSSDGIEALTDDDVVADHVADGGEIQTQPIAHSEVFGAR
jgi:hypothetical protein